MKTVVTINLSHVHPEDLQQALEQFKSIVLPDSININSTELFVVAEAVAPEEYVAP